MFSSIFCTGIVIIGLKYFIVQEIEGTDKNNPNMTRCFREAKGIVSCCHDLYDLSSATSDYHQSSLSLRNVRKMVIVFLLQYTMKIKIKLL